MEGFDSARRFPLSLSVDDLRVLKLGLAALQGNTVPVDFQESVSGSGNDLGGKVANLLQRLSDAEVALQSVPLPPYMVDDETYPAEELSQIRNVISVFRTSCLLRNLSAYFGAVMV